MAHLHYEIRGSGPTLVLLHGWALNLRVWDGLAAALRERFRVIAIDLPGHGRSGWLPQRSSLEEQVEQLRDTIGSVADEYSLLGWSLGGQLALQLAAWPQHGDGERQRLQTGGGRRGFEYPAPGRAGPRRLVLIATTPRWPASPDWPQGAPPERLARQAAGLHTDYRRTVSDFLELQVRGSAGGAAALEQLRAARLAHGAPTAATPTDATQAHAIPTRTASTHAPADAPSVAALARGLELLRDSDLRPLLSRITAPTLVIAGQYDRITPPAASHALAEALPNAQYVEIRRAAHAPFLSHLPQLRALLEDFLLH